MLVTYAHALMPSSPLESCTGEISGVFHDAVKEAALDSGVNFAAPKYQYNWGYENAHHSIRDGMKSFPLPALLGLWFANHEDKLVKESSPDSQDGLWIGSSVGAAIMMEAARNIHFPKDMILFRPVYDFFEIFSGLIGEEQFNMLINDGIDTVEVEFPFSEMGNDSEMLSVSSDDMRKTKGALRLFDESDEETVDELNMMFDPMNPVIKRMQIVCLETDPISPPSLAEKFANTIGQYTHRRVEITVIPEDVQDHSAWLKENVKVKLAAGWGRRP